MQDMRYLDQIEKGVGDLKEIAMKANEVRAAASYLVCLKDSYLVQVASLTWSATLHQAIKTTNVMLDNLEEKITDVQDKLDSVNLKLKKTLDTVGRRSDKMCIDIICIVLLLGMVGVLYRVITNSKK